MNIIMLNRFCQQAGSMELCLPKLLAGFGVIAVLLAVAGFWAGSQFSSTRIAMGSDIDVHDSLKDLLLRERQELQKVALQQQNNLNALAARMGRMQAELQRLDALGERLVVQGKLSADEFNFSAPAAIGGPDLTTSGESPSSDSLVADLQLLSKKISDRAQKLTMLENVLLYDELKTEMIPAGRPIKSGWLSSGYGKRTDPFTGKKTMHKGIDFASTKGTDIIALAAGVVTRVVKKPGYGLLLEIHHGGGYSTRYGHNALVLVSEGDVVKKGQVVASMGSTGRSTGPHVHLEVLHDGKIVNPSRFVASKD
ncbi:MAG: M23 family metallopeptidase [gamma proteobacterium symbiont of Bathyaustriella thionipta]|nr:M23 family metallopeptidase [gamma proteobacterium symbiont of Bathyaustriella thionipta]